VPEDLNKFKLYDDSEDGALNSQTHTHTHTQMYAKIEITNFYNFNGI
jgi:hypothetical protein